MIPFNKPHGIKIIEIQDNLVRTTIPFKRKNFNHIRGVHACGMATAAEFASGFLLLYKLKSKEYRLIMESLSMEYHYQAKKDVVATFELTDEWLDQNVRNPLKEHDKISVACKIMLHDSEGNHVATGTTNWQIKPWSAVKTKL